MDEQTRALYQQLLAELYRRMADDPQIRRALTRIEEGKATFLDTALWSDRSAELLGDVFSGAIVDMPAEARESLCKALLRERYDSTFDICGEVQEALDKRQGISLKPVKPKFHAERVQQIAHSLLDPTVAAAVIERRARAPVATAARSFHDDYIRENASVRTDLGFKCYLHRIAATGCCPWCTDIAGRYVYGDHPDDVFRRHDNCSCTVTFENGRQRQDVWSKKTWDAHDPKEIERLAQEPVVNSQERAREIEENAVSGLTLAGKRDIIEEREREFGVQYGERAIHADMDYIFSDEYAKIFSNITDVPEVNKTLLDCARAAIDHRNGTKFEDMYFIHAFTGEILASQTEMTSESGISYNDSIKELLRRAKEEHIPLVTVHNHPEGYPPSVDDFNKSFDNGTIFGLSVGHNGQVYKYDNPGKRTEDAAMIHDNISILCLLGSDPDRVYQEELSRYGLHYEILKGG